jgi:hypothetical protein
MHDSVIEQAGCSYLDVILGTYSGQTDERIAFSKGLEARVHRLDIGIANP